MSDQLRIVLEQLLGGIFNGLGIGAVLLIVALGLAIVFGLMGVINLAHGELMMLGAYATYVVQILPRLPENLGWTGSDSPGFAGLLDFWQSIYIFPALIVSFIVAALVGVLLERWVIRFLYGRPLETLLATWGVSLMLIEFVRSVNTSMVIAIALFGLLFYAGLTVLSRRPDWMEVQNRLTATVAIATAVVSTLVGYGVYRLGQNAQVNWLVNAWFGKQNKSVEAPLWLQSGWSISPTLQLPYNRIFIIVLTILCLVGVYWFLRGSTWGLRIRSVTQNRSMSACLGVPTERVDAITFALGSGLAGIAGCAITLLGAVGPNLGSTYIVDAFMVVVVGGVGNLVGTIVAALSIGVVQYLIGSGTMLLILPQEGVLQPVFSFFEFFADTSMAKVMVFALIIIFLQFRPRGLFPQKGRMVEA